MGTLECGNLLPLSFSAGRARLGRERRKQGKRRPVAALQSLVSECGDFFAQNLFARLRAALISTFSIPSSALLRSSLMAIVRPHPYASFAVCLNSLSSQLFRFSAIFCRGPGRPVFPFGNRCCPKAVAPSKRATRRRSALGMAARRRETENPKNALDRHQPNTVAPGLIRRMPLGLDCLRVRRRCGTGFASPRADKRQFLNPNRPFVTASSKNGSNPRCTRS